MESNMNRQSGTYFVEGKPYGWEAMTTEWRVYGGEYITTVLIRTEDGREGRWTSGPYGFDGMPEWAANIFAHHMVW